MELFGSIASIISLLVSNPKTVILLAFVIVSIGLILKYKLVINSIKYGLLDVFSQKDNTQKSNKKLSKKIRNAKKIDILYTTGAGFFGAFKTEFISALKENGADIRVLIGAKNQLFLKDVSDIEGRPPVDDINLEVEKVIGTIAEIRKAAGVDDTRIKLEHFSTEFRTSMILIDSGEKKWGKLTLTLPPLKAADSISFYIGGGKLSYNKNSDNIYEQCKDHFNKLWDYILEKRKKHQITEPSDFQSADPRSAVVSQKNITMEIHGEFKIFCSPSSVISP
jgi:hypothetical protein